jgi:transposase
MKTKFNFRFHVVEYAKTHSVSGAAREFRTTRKTVRKWVKRFKMRDLKALEDKSKAPHSCPHKLKELDENRIHLTREKYPQWGPRRLKTLARLPYGISSIYRVLKQRKLCEKKKKYQKKRDLREWKKKHFKVFEKFQVDVKHLYDIPEFYPMMKLLGLPRYELTARSIVSGATFMAYADENTTTNAGIFAEYVIRHLKYYGVDVTKTEFQYDNGSEFIGHASKKEGKTPFQERIDFHKLSHGRIPVASPTFNSDVESFHRIVEQEFYSCERFSDRTQFFAKAYSYQLFYNYFRPNSWKEDQTPWEIVKKAFPYLNKNVLNLQPIHLDLLTTQFIQGGYHLPNFPNSASQAGN